MTSQQDVVVLAVVGLLAGGIREEVQRAFILHRFEQHLGGAVAGLVCFSLLFGVGHALQGWPAVVTTTLLGAFWGLVYLAPPQHRRADGEPRCVQPHSDGVPAPAGLSVRCPRGFRRDLVVLVAAFVVTLPLVTPRIYASDEVQYFAYLRSLWFDRDLSFENQYQHFYDAAGSRNALFHETFLERHTEETGPARELRDAGLGAAVEPVLCRGRCVRGGATGDGSDDVVRDGYSQPYVAAVAYGSAFYGWLAVVLGWWMARRLVGERRAGRGAGRVVRHAAVLLHVHRAADVARLLGVRGGGFLWTWLRVRERWTVGRMRGARRAGGADGDGARAGRVHRAGTGARLARGRF